MPVVSESLDSNIIYYTGLISDPKNIVRYFEEDSTQKWEDWLSSDSTNIQHGFSKRVVFNDQHTDQRLVSISDKIKNAVTYVLDDYRSKIKGKDVVIPSFFDIKKYTDGANMGTHADSEDGVDKKHPVLSAVLYLNDDYVGGEIAFINQKVIVKPSEGSLIIFPSYPPYYHTPVPVYSGTKYMLPFFFYEKEMQ